MILMISLVIGCISFTSVFAFNVNHLNGSVNVTYIDFSVPGPVLPVELVRSYNSMTALSEKTGWNGAFGWGWASLPETILSATRNRVVQIRDGLSGNTITFTPEKEDPKIRSLFMASIKRAYFQKQRGRKLSDAELAKLSLPVRMESKLSNDPQYRAELAVQYQIDIAIPVGEKLVSKEFGVQTVEYRNNQWVREHDGITQFFDKNGRLVRQSDKNAFTLLFEYSPKEPNQVSAIQSEDGVVSLFFKWRGERVMEVVDNRSYQASYTYDSQGNLTQVTDSTKQVFNYKYGSKTFPHLITGIEYVTESKNQRVYRELKYDNAGLIAFNRDKEGAETTYTYGKNSEEPTDQFWTKIVTKFSGGSTSEQYFDYTLKSLANGTRYLHRQEVRKNGSSKITVFSPAGGKPIQIVDNGVTTNFKYFPNGLLKEKSGPAEDLQIEYDPRFRKITKIKQNSVTSTFRYDAKGNLVDASNSMNESVSLGYDRFGRIIDMRAPRGKLITFRYGNLGKPTLIESQGIGSVKITYDPTGRIIRTETLRPTKIGGRVPTEKRPQEVVRSVMQGFRELLKIIRPAGVQVPVG